MVFGKDPEVFFVFGCVALHDFYSSFLIVYSV